MSGSAGSGAARKNCSQEIFCISQEIFLLIAYFSLDTWNIIAKVMQITLYIAE